MRPAITAKMFAAPKEIPNSILPSRHRYVIRTRIVIEGAMVQAEDEEWPQQIWAVQPKEAVRQLRIAEAVYADLHIEFHVTEIVFRKYTENFLEHFGDSVRNPNAMSVHWMLPNSFLLAGVSSGPWDEYNTGILLGYKASEWVLTHEIGHFFGLLHPFFAFGDDGDMVSDTPTQLEVTCFGKENATPNCKNSLSYCNHAPKFVTPGQIDRMRKFIRAERMDFVLPIGEVDGIFKFGLPKIQSKDFGLDKASPN